MKINKTSYYALKWGKQISPLEMWATLIYIDIYIYIYNYIYIYIYSNSNSDIQIST